MSNRVAKKVMSFLGGVLCGVAVVMIVKSVYEYANFEQSYKENHIYGRLNAEKQVIYITGEYHGEKVKATANLSNTKLDMFATSGLYEGKIGDKAVNFSFSVDDTEDGTEIADGLIYYRPVYDEEFIEQFFPTVDLTDEATRDNAYSIHYLMLNINGTDKWTYFYDTKIYGETLAESFPAIRAVLTEDDLKQELTVRTYRELNNAEDSIKKFKENVLVVEITGEDILLQFTFPDNTRQ